MIGSAHILLGDCRERMAAMEAESVDAVVTDPPAGISFMGKLWDHDHGGRDKWIAAFAAIFRECYRVMKPGAHGLVWALPRTSHWTATALEDAGFEVRDVLLHLFGSGFPKSANVSKNIDKAAGDVRPETGETYLGATNISVPGAKYIVSAGAPTTGRTTVRVTSAASAASAAWEGWGTALKPAAEHWILVRKPLGSTVAACVLKHGTGAINVDGCRIGTTVETWHASRSFRPGISGGYTEGADKGPTQATGPAPSGRWPANCVLSHTPECREVGTRKVKGHAGYPNGPRGNRFSVGDGPDGSRTEAWAGHPDADVPAFDCAPSCPVRMLDEQSGESASPMSRERTPDGPAQATRSLGRTGGVRVGHGDSGGASRFFYTAKASRADREGSNHPCMKPTDLMRWLCKLVTPPGGLILDPFCGSGSTGVAAVAEGFRFIGIEQDADYVEIAKRRIANVAPLFNEEEF